MKNDPTLLVTGGCGFIGSAVIRMAVSRGLRVVNVDALTYAANPAYNKLFTSFMGFVKRAAIYLWIK